MRGGARSTLFLFFFFPLFFFFLTKISPGALLFEQGEDATFLCLIETGALLVYSGGERVARLSSGCIGEMALVDGTSRTAAVRADKEGATILKMVEKNFEELIFSSEFGTLFLINLLGELNEKLHKANSRIKLRSVISTVDVTILQSARGSICSEKMLRPSWEEAKNRSVCCAIPTDDLIKHGKLGRGLWTDGPVWSGRSRSLGHHHYEK
jgi:hypothetical protein